MIPSQTLAKGAPQQQHTAWRTLEKTSLPISLFLHASRGPAGNLWPRRRALQSGARLHQGYDFTIQPLRGVQAPDEIKVVPVRQEVEVPEIPDLGDYPGHVRERHKDVIATSPHGSRHLHGGQVIERGTALGRERKSVQERKLLTASTGFRYTERRLKEYLLRILSGTEGSRKITCNGPCLQGKIGQQTFAYQRRCVKCHETLPQNNGSEGKEGTTSDRGLPRKRSHLKRLLRDGWILPDRGEGGELPSR